MTTTPAAASPSAATPIYTFADILAAMEHNPELRSAMRQHILEQEFQQLPTEMQELRQIAAELQQTLRDFIAATNARFDRLEAGQAELRSGQDAHTARLERLEAGQDELRADVAELKTGMDELRSGQDAHTARLERLEAGQDELRADVAELKTGMDELRAGQRTMQGNINRLIGKEYERTVTRQAIALVGNSLDAPAPQVIWAETHQDNTELPHLLKYAVRVGRITADEASMVRSADIVLRDGAGGYCLAEVSITLDDSDITRARRRADLLAQAANASVSALVIGTHILDTSRDLADAQQVTVCIQEDW